MSGTVRVGLFTVCALAIFSSTIFFIGKKDFVFTRTFRLYAPFDTVAGLPNGAEVRAGGVSIGTVQSIQVPTRPGQKVLVAMNLKRSAANVIRKDSVAEILTEGLMGNKYVSLSFGSDSSPPAREGDFLRSRPPVDFSDVMAKTDKILDQTRSTMANVEEASSDLKTIAGKINRGDGTIGSLINSNQVSEEVTRTLAEARSSALAFHDNMEALKSSWFFRGFYNDRGYKDPEELRKSELAKLPQEPVVRKFTFLAKDIFDASGKARLRNEKLLQDAGRYLESDPFHMAAVVTYTGPEGEKDRNALLSQAEAVVVRNYLIDHFRIDDTRVKTHGMGEDQDVDGAGRVEILIW